MKWIFAVLSFHVLEELSIFDMVDPQLLLPILGIVLRKLHPQMGQKHRIQDQELEPEKKHLVDLCKIFQDI